jgi:hypothetical protein
MTVGLRARVEKSMPAVVIIGQVTGLSEAQWQEIKQSVAKRGIDLDTQTLGKLAEIPSILIVELRDAIKAELAQPTRSEMAKRVAATRESRQFDETDPNMIGLIEPNFSDRQRRTPERVRKLADKAFDICLAHWPQSAQQQQIYFWAERMAAVIDQAASRIWYCLY